MIWLLVLPLLALAYVYGVRVGLRAGYVKGGDDMAARFLI